MSHERDIVDTTDWRKERDDLLVEMQERQERSTPKDVVASVISMELTDLYLIQQRLKGGLAGKWEIPGGKVQKGEEKLAALLREMREEVGDFRYVLGSKIFEAVHEYDWGNFRVHFYSVTMAERILPYTGAEGQPIKWIKPSEVNQYDLIGSDSHMIVVDAFKRGWIR